MLFADNLRGNAGVAAGYCCFAPGSGYSSKPIGGRWWSLACCWPSPPQLAGTGTANTRLGMPRLKPKPPRLWQMAKIWPGLQNSADGWRARGLSMLQKPKLLPRWITQIVPGTLLRACAHQLPVSGPPPDVGRDAVRERS